MTRPKLLAIDFALALARKLAGDALDASRSPAIADAAAPAFQHLRGVPHFVVRVNDDLVEPVDALLEQLAEERGFEGRLVTLGDPDMEPGTCGSNGPTEVSFARDRMRKVSTQLSHSP